MHMNEIRSSIDLIRDASKADLIIVSLLLLPLVLGAWSLLLNSVPGLDKHGVWKGAIIAGLFVGYVVGVAVMKCWDPVEERLKRARRHVQNRLRQRRGHRASFDAIRSEVNLSYTREFLERLIELNPDLFRRCTLKLSTGDKPGIALETEEPPAQQGDPGERG